MFESKAGVFLIAGLGSFAIAFLSNALLPILMYRHLPEKSVEEVINYRVMTHLTDLQVRYPEQFEKYAGLQAGQPVTTELAASLLREGRKVYVAEGCWHCHSQFIRPVSNESKRWGPVSKSWEYQNELQRPVMFGTRRVGPDLSRETNRRGNDWHAAHFYKPKLTSPESIMPEYPWFFDREPSEVTAAKSPSTDPDEGSTKVQWVYGNENIGRPNRRGLAIILYMQWLGSELEGMDRSGDHIRTNLQFTEANR